MIIRNKMSKKHGNNTSLDILAEYCNSFFPVEGKWYSTAFKRSKELKEDYFVCNVRDDNWMCDYLYEKHFTKNKNISKEQLFVYISCSPLYAMEREAYELRVIRWQINYMNNGGSNYSAPSSKLMALLLMSKDDYLQFKKDSAYMTLSKIGMNDDILKKGLKLYENEWAVGDLHNPNSSSEDAAIKKMAETIFSLDL